MEELDEMDDSDQVAETVPLSGRVKRSARSVQLFSALEPAHCVSAIRESRSRLVLAIKEADNDQLPALVNALIRVLEFGGRFYGLPSAPKGTAAKPGDNARPVLPMES